MPLEYDQWLEPNKNKLYRCNWKKNTKMKSDCHWKSQSLEHSDNHDPNSANRIYQSYKEYEMNKEEKKK